MLFRAVRVGGHGSASSVSTLRLEQAHQRRGRTKLTPNGPGYRPRRRFAASRSITAPPVPPLATRRASRSRRERLDDAPLDGRRGRCEGLFDDVARLARRALPAHQWAQFCGHAFVARGLHVIDALAHVAPCRGRWSRPAGALRAPPASHGAPPRDPRPPPGRPRRRATASHWRPLVRAKLSALADLPSRKPYWDCPSIAPRAFQQPPFRVLRIVDRACFLDLSRIIDPAARNLNLVRLSRRKALTQAFLALSSRATA